MVCYNFTFSWLSPQRSNLLLTLSNLLLTLSSPLLKLSRPLLTLSCPQLTFIKPATHLIKPATNLIMPTTHLIKPATHLIKPATHFIEPAAHIMKPLLTSLSRPLINEMTPNQNLQLNPSFVFPRNETQHESYLRTPIFCQEILFSTFVCLDRICEYSPPFKQPMLFLVNPKSGKGVAGIFFFLNKYVWSFLFLRQW